MVDKGFLSYHEETGKGGYHGVNIPKMDESSFKTQLAHIMITRMMTDYPEETMKAIKSIK